jgi:hypothetical protein
MTETQWLSCRRVFEMTVFLRDRITDRKARLFSGGEHVKGCWALDLVLGKE